MDIANVSVFSPLTAQIACETFFCREKLVSTLTSTWAHIVPRFIFHFFFFRNSNTAQTLWKIIDTYCMSCSRLVWTAKRSLLSHFVFFFPAGAVRFFTQLLPAWRLHRRGRKCSCLCDNQLNGSQQLPRWGQTHSSSFKQSVTRRNADMSVPSRRGDLHRYNTRGLQTQLPENK